ncbi:MAG: HAMP domain-containing histidine kinase [Ignavibacteriae bacterium]|nr:HAMP domain-containing histidine kinase [Ignavibacteriota bacterium]
MKEKSLKIIIALITFAVVGLIAIQFYWVNLALKLEEEKFNKNVGNALNDLVRTIEDRETSKILIKELSPKDSNKVIFLNKGKKKNFEYNSKFNSNKNQVMIIGNDSNNINIEVNTTSDSALASMKVLQKFRTQNDSTIEETIIWQSDIDTLIHRKTKIIENVFDELVFTEKNQNILKRISEVKLDSLLNDELNKYGINSNYGFAIVNNDSLILDKNFEDMKDILQSNYKVKLFPNDFIKNQNFLVVDFKNRNVFLFKSIWWILVISIILTALIILLFYLTIKMLIRQKKITEVKNDLLNNITHEFKTPISTISLAADVINEEPDIDTKKYSAIIKNESQRLTNMVETILSAAELENSKFELNKTNEDIHKIIFEVSEKYELPIDKKFGKIIYDLKATDTNLSVDILQITNAISNLIDNAIKYNVGNPEIKISTMNSNSTFEIVIEDNGIGIDKKYHNKIFDTFYRIPTGNIHDVKGNGIGLSTVKKIIEAHLGKIILESEKNKGSKFIINLPKIN